MLKLQPKLVSLSHTIPNNGRDYQKVRSRWFNVDLVPHSCYFPIFRPNWLLAGAN